MTLLMITLFTASLSAQSNTSYEDYFTGKWKFTLKDLVNYDINMVLDIKKSEGTIRGEVSIPGSGEAPLEITGITLIDSTFACTSAVIGFDMPLIITKKDEKNVTGTMFGIHIEGLRSEQE